MSSENIGTGLPSEVREFFSRAGKKGGAIASKVMTAEQKRARALKANAASHAAKKARKERLRAEMLEAKGHE